ncbi:hypothetical protein B0T19DRAFT_458968, partial [Cercophora scortea]
AYQVSVINTLSPLLCCQPVFFLFFSSTTKTTHRTAQPHSFFSKPLTLVTHLPTTRAHLSATIQYLSICHTITMETNNIMNGKIPAERAPAQVKAKAFHKKGSNKKAMLNLVFLAAAAVFCASAFLDIIQVGSNIGALAADGVTSPGLAIIAARDAPTDDGPTDCTTSLTTPFPSPSATTIATSATSAALAEGASTTCNSSTMTVTVTSAQTATATVSVTGTDAAGVSESWAGTTTVTVTPSGAATVTVILNPEDNSTTTLTDMTSGLPLSTMASDLPVSGAAAVSGIWTTVTSANGTYTYSVPASATATAGQPVPTAGAPPTKKNKGTTAYYCAVMAVMISAYFMRF